MLESSGPLLAWIDEADQNPQIICPWWTSRSSNDIYWSKKIGKGPYKSIIENQGIKKVGLSETHASGNREASTHNDSWKTNRWNKYQQERSDMEWWTLRIFKWGSVHTLTEPWRRIEDFFIKIFMEWRMLIFSDRFFRKILRVSYTCSRNYSVYDGVRREGVHTHIFLFTARSLRTRHIFMRVHRSRVCKSFIAHVSHLSISPSPFWSFTRLPWCSLTVTSRSIQTTTSVTPTSTWSCRTFRRKSAGHAPLRTCITKFGNLTRSDANTHWSSTGILLNDKARDWSIVTIRLQGCCRTPLLLQISPATTINDPEFEKGIAIRTLMFCRILAMFEDLCLVHVGE